MSLESSDNNVTHNLTMTVFMFWNFLTPSYFNGISSRERMKYSLELSSELPYIVIYLHYSLLKLLL